MAQRISQMPNAQALPATQEGFLGSNLGRGNGSMLQPNAGMDGQKDGSSYTDMNANPQFARNTAQQMQTIQQNGLTTASQMGAKAVGEITAARTLEGNAKYKAVMGKDNYVANVMNAYDLGNATAELGRIPLAKIQNDVYVNQQLANRGVAELGQLEAENKRYS